MHDGKELSGIVKTLPERLSMLARTAINDPGVLFLIDILKVAIGPASPIVDLYLRNIREKIDASLAKRLRLFFQDIAIGKIDLSQEVIESDDFLYCYFSTVSAVVAARRTEKIRLISELFINGVKNNIIAKLPDEYEEDLKVLDDLTYKEIEFLVLYDNWVSKNQENKEHQKQKEELLPLMKMSEDEYGAFVLRLSRSGCIITMAGLGGPIVLYGLSPLYYRLKQRAFAVLG